jgi:hypothetical protein
MPGESTSPDPAVINNCGVDNAHAGEVGVAWCDGGAEGTTSYTDIDEASPAAERLAASQA